VAVKVDSHKGFYNNPVMKALGIYVDVDIVLDILNRAIDLTENSILDDSWFFYKDFSFDHTCVVSHWPLFWMELHIAALVVPIQMNTLIVLALNA
jgi:hypothetical protein